MVKISVGIKALHILAVKRRKVLLFLTSGYTSTSSEIDFAGCFLDFMDNSESQ